MILLIVFRTFNASLFVWCQPAPTNGNIFVLLAFFWSNFHRLLSIYTNFILCNDQQLRSSYTNSNNHTWIITSNHFISHFWCSISTWNYCIFYFVKEPMESRIPITIIHTSFTVPLRIFLWIHFKCTVPSLMDYLSMQRRDSVELQIPWSKLNWNKNHENYQLIHSNIYSEVLCYGSKVGHHARLLSATELFLDVESQELDLTK